MDLIVKLPPSEGFTNIFMVVDHLSKMAHFVPLKETLSALLLKQLPHLSERLYVYMVFLTLSSLTMVYNLPLGSERPCVKF